MKFIDLRSDTVTRPSPGMRKAMAEAEVGDDVYGEDPTVRRLEEACAGRVGHEAGLFVPSGTMGNQLGIGLHCRSGDELVADEHSHCIHYETGAIAALWGVQPFPVKTERGRVTPAQVRASVRPNADFAPRTTLLVLENTHGATAGSVWALEDFRATVAAARELGLSVHLDGARIFNAEVASGVPAKSFAGLVDTVSVCLSKGLGAPVGTVLCASAARIREARRLRKRLGGAMRQVGILAAAGLYALEHNVSRLADDHRNATRLAELLKASGRFRIERPPETNLVFAGCDDAPGESARLKERGVLANAAAPDRLRFVTHLDVSAEEIEEVGKRLA